MGKWDKLNKEFDDALENLTTADWENWDQQKRVILNTQVEVAEVTKPTVCRVSLIEKAEKYLVNDPVKQNSNSEKNIDSKTCGVFFFV